MRALLLLLAFSWLSSAAQPFLIGSRTITFFDAGRNRDIETNLYYPALTAGNNAAMADGHFPVLVIGHGFVMTPNAYANLWNHFVPRGYIVALPTTEGGFAPDHGEFGLDLAFIAQALQTANNDGASPFYQHVAPTTGLMGHSMGGGASFLGAANNTAITTLVNFAAAETNPSAVAAASQVLVPTLVFAGSNDCITPIPDHQQPMYDALTVPCRAFVNITGGGHCYFAESNFNCAFGELTCQPTPDITRAEQHDVVNDFADLWLDHFLKGDQQALPALLDSIATSSRAASVHTCEIISGVAAITEQVLHVWPVPASDVLILGGIADGALVSMHDVTGRLVMNARPLRPGEPIDVRALAPGNYHLLILSTGRTQVHRVLVSR